MGTKLWTGGGGDLAWSTAGNWSPSVPVGGDDVVFDATAATGVNGSDQSALTINSLTILSTFGSGVILFGSNGTPLKINVTSSVRIGDPSASPTPASGAQRINLDLATSAPVVTVAATNTTSVDAGKEVCRIRVNNNLCDINVLAGSVGVATDNYTDSSTLHNVNVSGGTCNVGANVTYATLTNNGGTARTKSTPGTALICFAGDIFTYGTYLVPTITIDGGTVHPQHRASAGASVTQLNLRGGGQLDLSQNGEAITMTNFSFRNGSIVSFSDTQLTVTNNISLDFDAAARWSGSNS